MSTERTCPNCREIIPADAPAGVCPACALRAGFASVDLGSYNADAGDDAPTRTAPGRRAAPFEPEELARRLPELEDFELLGQGGMGAVYRARHRRLARPVAVKVLAPELGEDPAFAERFAREARTLAKLDHPHIVRVYDFDHRDGLYVLIMELVDGVDLRQTIRTGSLEPEQALALVPSICDALQYAHDQGVVHRDIKPENILIDRRGTVKIADFGLAKLLGDASDSHLTRSRQVMGTPNYMAPEQVERPEKVDHRADIFALGVVFYELLTGELPLGRFPLPSKTLQDRRVQIDVRLDEVVLRTLEKEPALRYQQARELRSDVESLSSSRGTVPPPPALGAATEPTAPAKKTDFEYRSAERFLGIPLVHIAFSRDPEGTRMRLARGWIAVGDSAVGAIAIGGFAIGGVALGGGAAGLVTFAGLAVGLLTAMGGIAVGAYAKGGSAFGALVGGSYERTLYELPESWLQPVELAGWFLASCGITALAVGGFYAGYRALDDRNKGGRKISENQP